MQFLDLIDDILIIVIEYLNVPAILHLRKTCRRLHELARTRSVWLNACKTNVLEKKLPFPDDPIESLTSAELEARTRRALLLCATWTSAHPEPKKTLKFQANRCNIISEVRFVLRGNHKWLLTVSNGIWSTLSCWDLLKRSAGGPRKIGEWTYKGALIRDIVVNSDPRNDGCLAVSITKNGRLYRTEIQTIKPALGSDPAYDCFETLATLHKAYRAIALQGDIIATSNELSETRITNWRTGHIAILKSSDEAEENVQRNRCLKVVFCHDSILVGRARSLSLFHSVELRAANDNPSVLWPIAQHSFGWIGEIAVVPQTEMDSTWAYPALLILLRAENDDPWQSDIHNLNYYAIVPNPAYVSGSPSPHSPSSESPYLFPPALEHRIPSRRGFLRCTDLALGPCGTALWIQPHERHVSHPLQPLSGEVGDYLFGAVLDGSLRQSVDNIQGAETITRKGFRLWFNSRAAWTSLDYCESLGCIALASSDGQVTILEMGC